LTFALLFFAARGLAALFLFAGARFFMDADRTAPGCAGSTVTCGAPQHLSGRHHKFSDVSFDTSFLFGGKAGLFFDPSILGGHLGLELEVYHFQPDVGEQVVQGTFPGFAGPATVGSNDVHVTVVGLNALYRFRFAEDPQFPRGRFQPYVGIGVGAFIANLKTTTGILDVPQTVSDTDVKPGCQATVGTRFFLIPHLSLFTEYKYTHTNDFNFNLISGPGTIAGAPSFPVNNFKFDLTTQPAGRWAQLPLVVA
jgi:opacity protein-like surface antigen